MFFQIREIVLWPKKKGLKPRRLKFETGKVNVITGSSRSGKSAIIPIIDYCLGSGKCRIPVKTIRDSSEWFGVLIETEYGQKLFARREPGLQKATGDMYVLEGEKIEVPEIIEDKNSNTDLVKRNLDEIAGLTDLGFMDRPSFCDLSSFTFQPQNIIANPEAFFYKTDTYKHRKKLITIFPYVLNAITPELMAKKHELAELKRLLGRKQNELNTLKKVSEGWLAEIRSKVSTAMELGLITEPVPAEVSHMQLIDLLKKSVHSSTDEIKVTEKTISKAVQELVDIQKEEEQVSMELSVQRKRLAEMSVLIESTVDYKETLYIQRDRLQISKWLSQIYQKNHDCPICGNQAGNSKESLDSFLDALKNIEEEAGRFDAIPAAFDREYNRVKADIRTLVEKLRGIQIRRKALVRESGEAKQRQYDSLKISRFIGNIEESLKTYERIGSDSALINELNELRDKVKHLEREISEASVQKKVNRALDIISSNSGRLLPFLDLERPDDPIRLEIEDLTIKVIGIDRKDYLWEIGSGSNWLSYHVAVTLGLQQFFLDLKRSPVPGFIVYDQPSQVYFPKRQVVTDDEEDFDPEYRDEDIEAVKKVFSVMASSVNKNDARLQIIVLDHADKDVWGQIENIHCIEEWRNGIKLIPKNWYI